MELEDDLPKENAPPSPSRRRSTSLLSQSALLPTVASSPPVASPATVLAPVASPAPPPATVTTSRTRASLSTIFTSADPVLDDTGDDESAPPSPTPVASGSSIFPSWTETTSAFAEGGNLNMESYDSGLLPGFSLAFSPRKRPSLGDEGGNKRARPDENE